MVKCIALEMCFIGGKRVRAGEHVTFEGEHEDTPKYLRPTEKPKKKPKKESYSEKKSEKEELNKTEGQSEGHDQ